MNLTGKQLEALREAAKRLVAYGKAVTTLGWPDDLCHIEKAVIEDGIHLALAYLAEHPNDEEEQP